MLALKMKASSGDTMVSETTETILDQMGGVGRLVKFTAARIL